MKASYRETIIKTIIWRIIAVIITFATAFLLTGNVLIGVGIGSFDALLKTIAYFLFERAWQKHENKE